MKKKSQRDKSKLSKPNRGLGEPDCILCVRRFYSVGGKGEDVCVVGGVDMCVEARDHPP